MSRKRRSQDASSKPSMNREISQTKEVSATEIAQSRVPGAIQSAVQVTSANGHKILQEENDALADEFMALRNAGLVIELIPLEQIKKSLLVRERTVMPDPELEDLVISLRDIGLSNPIRVEQTLKGNGYELIQGMRRLEAYRTLYAETNDARWASIPALIMPPGDGIDTLYRRMIDENVVRKDLSFAEMAEAARNFAADPATGVSDVSDAVPILFQSASYAKRSYIRSFARLLELVGTSLKYPNEIPRSLGLDLLKQLEAEPDLRERLIAALSNWENRSVADELGVLREMAHGDLMVAGGDEIPRRIEKKAMADSVDQSKIKTTFDIHEPRGKVRCTAGVGRVEIKFKENFTMIDRAQLERAISRFLDDVLADPDVAETS